MMDAILEGIRIAFRKGKILARGEM